MKYINIVKLRNKIESLKETIKWKRENFDDQNVQSLLTELKTLEHLLDCFEEN